MSYTNSPLVTYTRISPNKGNWNKELKKYVPARKHMIDTITIHCFVGQVTAKTGCAVFARPARKASCNYVVGYDGSIGLCVEEKDRSWCSSSSSNDNRAITIEVASTATEPYTVTNLAYQTLIKLVVDICQRNNIKELKWQDDKSLIGQIDKQNMTLHRWFANKKCPGDYLYKRHYDIAKQVNNILNPPAPVPVDPTWPTDPYQYVDSTGYIIQVFDIKTQWQPWFASTTAYYTYPKFGWTAKDFAMQQNSELVFTLAPFNPETYEGRTYVRTSQYEEVSYGGTLDKIEFNWANKCSGGAVLIKNGVNVAPYDATSTYCNAIGMTTDGRLIIATSKIKTTNAQFANFVSNFIIKAHHTSVQLLLSESNGTTITSYAAASKLSYAVGALPKIPLVTCLKRQNLPKITRVLQRDSHGYDVMLLQMVLGGITVDGWYGTETLQRVKAAQKALGLTIDGSCGPKTLAALGLS